MSDESSDLARTDHATIVALAAVADEHARSGVFNDYVMRRSTNTLRAQRADLALWCAYLTEVGAGLGEVVDVDALQRDPSAWRGVTWGMVAGFVKWLLRDGYALGSVARALSTMAVYCRLAMQAGVISAEELALIRSVRTYRAKEARRVDERRERTRRGHKKAKSVLLTFEQANQLKVQPATPQGRRDAVIMALLLDHGLRVGELAILKVSDFDVQRGVFVFYRPKVDKTQTHRLTADSMRAVVMWLATDAPAMGPLLRGSRKGGALTGPGMSADSISERVRALGKRIGVVGLSAHDCRHYWATRAASQGTDPFALRDAGGWASLAMPSRYVAAAEVANERVKL